MIFRRRLPLSHSSGFDRAGRIGELWLDPRSRTFAELLIDCEDDPYTRAVILVMLREEELRGGLGGC